MKATWVVDELQGLRQKSLDRPGNVRDGHRLLDTPARVYRDIRGTYYFLYNKKNKAL
jgi:hypothetical protein